MTYLYFFDQEKGKELLNRVTSIFQNIFGKDNQFTKNLFNSI